MKRTLTSVATAAMVLGTAVPMAFAATTSNYQVAHQLPIVVNGNVLSNPYELTAQDSGNTTAYFPMYYFNQALNSIGFTATWDGINHVWNVTAPGVNASSLNIAGGVGTGNTSIAINGTVVKKINTFAAKDPAASKSAAPTTYFPAFYLDEIFNQLGATVSFSGTTGLNVKSAPQAVGAAQLSSFAVSGQTSGSGTASSPAVSLNGGKMTLSTKLTDANGNPVANTQVTFAVTGSDSIQPGATNANGSSVTGSQVGSSYTYNYNVYTDSTGTATLVLSAPSGNTRGYTVQASAPFQVSGSNISNASVNLEFVANGQAGITPYAPTPSSAYKTTFGNNSGAVPVTVVLPPNATGNSQAGVSLTFSVDGTNSAYFTNSTGAYLGRTTTVLTNGSGTATVWVTDSSADSAVQVNAVDSTNTYNLNTYISWSQAGVSAQIANFQASNSSPTAGQQVTLTGTVEDASGNPIANAQLLLTGTHQNGNSYVSGGTTTAFPNVTVGVGVPATSSYGEVLTTDANGNFSAVVTDNTAETNHYNVYAVQNGEVSNATALGSLAVVYGTSSTLSGISVYAFAPSSIGGTDSDTLTGLQAQAGGAAQKIYFAPQTATGGLTNQSITYTLSATNGAVIANVNGTTLNNQVSGVQLTFTYNGNGTYTVSVPGQTISTNYAPSTGELFYVGLSNTATGASTLSVTSGSAKGTATVNFISSGPNSATSFPASIALNPGQYTTFTYEVEDTNGNPVANSATQFNFDNNSAANLWITAANGVTLTTPESVNGSVQNEPTPIPLGAASGSIGGNSYITSYNVSVPGVASWTNNTGSATFYTDSKGMVTLTVQAGGVSFWNGTSLATAPTPTTGSTNAYTYNDNYTNNTTYQVYIGGSAPSAWSTNAQQVGQFSW